MSPGRPRSWQQDASDRPERVVFRGDRYRAAMSDGHAELPPVDRAAFAGRYGPRALVAGGASGIGAEYCRQIAALGIDLAILDRDEPELDATATELRSAPHAVDVVTAVVDLGQPAEALLDAVRRAVGDLEIGLLVANAAWSPVGPFLDSDLAALLSAIDINCRAPVVLAHELGARMADRGRGGIILMSSLAAETGTANVALYSATKAFDLVLAEGLWYELRDRGVDVIAIRPGSTRTPGWQSTQPASGELRGVMEPADVVRDALAALGTTPSIAAGAANRAAEARFRSMARRDVIELMSGITSRLVPPDSPPPTG
jgi:short-subunit dehydrogenase